MIAHRIVRSSAMLLLSVIGSVDRGQQIKGRQAIRAVSLVTAEERDGMVEECPRLGPCLEFDESHGQDHLCDDRSSVVTPESVTTGLIQFSIKRENFPGPSRLPEPVRQVVGGDKGLPTPRSVPLLVEGQGMQPGGKDLFRRGVGLRSVLECVQCRSSEPPPPRWLAHEIGQRVGRSRCRSNEDVTTRCP